MVWAAVVQHYIYKVLFFISRSFWLVLTCPPSDRPINVTTRLRRVWMLPATRLLPRLMFGSRRDRKASAILPCSLILTFFFFIGRYVLIAASEIFASITGLEYAFTKAPKNMRSLVMSVFLFMSAISSALGEAFVCTFYFSKTIPIPHTF
jgi:hypothetical protein